MQVMSGARIQVTVTGKYRARALATAGRTDGAAVAGAAFAEEMTARGKRHGCGPGASRDGARRGGRAVGARRRPSDNHRPVAPRPAYRSAGTGAEGRTRVSAG